MNLNKLSIIFLLLFICAAQLNAQTCAEDQTSFKRINNDLKATRASIKKSEADLDEKNNKIHYLHESIAKLHVGMNVGLETGSPEYKAMAKQVDDQLKVVEIYEKDKAKIQKDLAAARSEETILLSSFHLVRDRIDKNCGGVKKEQSKTAIVDVSGKYNSTYGEAILTQKPRTKLNVVLSAVVHYTTGGTSNLVGIFDGVHWNYTWRNSFGHHGTGDMVYGSDESFSGTWIDKSLDPTTKGTWWLRPK